MFDYLVGILGFAYFASISLATKQHFRSERYPAGMYVISMLSLLGIGVLMWHAAQQAIVLVGPCLALIVAAQGLFAWAIRHSRNRNLKLALDSDPAVEGLIKTGPWRYMRHPFYASYSIFWLGCAVGTQHLLSVIVFLTLFGIYIYSALKEEGALTSGPLRTEYIDYRERVGFFFPKIPLRQ